MSMSNTCSSSPYANSRCASAIFRRLTDQAQLSRHCSQSISMFEQGQCGMSWSEDAHERPGGCSTGRTSDGSGLRGRATERIVYRHSGGQQTRQRDAAAKPDRRRSRGGGEVLESGTRCAVRLGDRKGGLWIRETYGVRVVIVAYRQIARGYRVHTAFPRNFYPASVPSKPGWIFTTAPAWR